MVYFLKHLRFYLENWISNKIPDLHEQFRRKPRYWIFCFKILQGYPQRMRLRLYKVCFLIFTILFNCKHVSFFIISKLLKDIIQDRRLYLTLESPYYEFKVVFTFSSFVGNLISCLLIHIVANQDLGEQEKQV